MNTNTKLSILVAAIVVSAVALCHAMEDNFNGPIEHSSRSLTTLNANGLTFGQHVILMRMDVFRTAIQTHDVDAIEYAEVCLRNFDKIFNIKHNGKTIDIADSGDAGSDRNKVFDPKGRTETFIPDTK